MDYSGDRCFDVIVVGAGVMGSSAAYQLSKRGLKTLLLEQFDFLHHRGSSHGESRTIRATYPEDYYNALVAESAELWEVAQSEIGYRVHFPTKHFDMGPTDQKSLNAVVATCRKHGLPHRILDSRAVAEFFSGRFNIPENWVGITTEIGGVIKPTKAVSMFQTLAMRNGAVLRDNTKVDNIVKDEETGGGVVVSTANGDKFLGKKCIITAGAWIPKLVKTVAGKDIPVEPLETTVCYWRIKEGHEGKFAIDGDFPTFASYSDPYVYGTPSLEYPGLIKVAVHGGNRCDPDKRPWRPGVRLEELKEWIKERFGGMVDWAKGPVATQLCIYSMTPDEDFVMDFLGGEFGKDVVVGGGFSGHGFKMAPAVGRILGELATEGVAGGGVELKHFSLRRFEENPKGNAKEYPDKVVLGAHPQ
ncbi:PREDICTED: probable sarcosine oxidase [Tarenaya hassleriana]|uniref:probable sarcosine oxidase n=1 Tax=Tarenaya hassleriana TaxID=28532 RepID=UPI00053C851F|nr:PREDICTED: probable sarcosine oxidase [Tarenaya hassleriana]